MSLRNIETSVAGSSYCARAITKSARAACPSDAPPFIHNWQLVAAEK